MIRFEISTSEFETNIRPHGPDFVCGATISAFPTGAECYTTFELTLVVAIER